MSLILTFVECCCYVEKGLDERSFDLWEAYEDWVRLSDLKPISKNSFHSRMGDFFAIKRNPERFGGLRLKEDNDWEILDRDTARRVYLISDGKFVKIGVSLDPSRRLRKLQTGSSRSLKLIGSIPGGYQIESLLHKFFEDKRISKNREWFSLTHDDVLSVLRGAQI